MKRTLIFIFLILTLIIYANCNSNYNNGDNSEETKPAIKTETNIHYSEPPKELQIDEYVFETPCNYKISSEESLRLVKDYISESDDSVFEDFDNENGPLAYFYKNSNYRIEYKKVVDSYHLIQDYEVVIDNDETGEGHTATKNWYKVDVETGIITAMFDKNGNLNDNY